MSELKSQKNLICYNCGQQFQVQLLGTVLVYDKNKPYPVPVHLFTNVQYNPPVKYFCKRSCKEKYLEKRYKKKKF